MKFVPKLITLALIPAAFAAIWQGDPSAFTIEGPLKFAARPTSKDITPIDLMSRLYIFADDSMMGRDDGGPLGNLKATKYVADEARRMGLFPAGDNGTYFQDIGYKTTLADARSTMSVDGQALVLNKDYTPVPRVGAKPVRDEGDVIFGGTLDSIAHITSDQAYNKIVLFQQRPGRGRGNAAIPTAFRDAAAIAVIVGDSLPTPVPARGLVPDDAARIAAGPMRVNVTRAVAQRMLGVDPASAQPGTVGKKARLDFIFAETKWPVRNVVAYLPGDDRRRAGEYVSIGAHTDHVGFNMRPVDHDSLRAFNMVMRPRGANDTVAVPTADQAARIARIRDSLSKLHPARRDSINNGADDDGSGTVTLLEIAEAFARGDRPKRSVLFVWHAAEEDGLLGSRVFAEHPTVPRDSIIANINMDMVGRGRAVDHEGGGPNYLRSIGARRLSTDLGDLVERVNTQQKHNFVFDYSFDTPGHPLNVYCRSDHASYARWGIPVVSLGTGTQADYHMVTDEPQYIDYPHMARIGRFIRDIAMALGNADRAPVVDKQRPDPSAPCRQ
jgi:hypothetical protein